jgi:SagB-type dehydrogenase family enzyme
MELKGGLIKLPEPERSGRYTLEEVLWKRRSVRAFRDEPLTLKEVSQLLWATQGLRDRRGYRTAPSAGAQYPLEIHLVVGKVEGLDPGSYRYLVEQHSLRMELEGDLRRALFKAALHQDFILDAPATIVISAIFERTTWRYGKRGIRYVYLNAGHAGQNLYLEATALDLGTVAVGAFHDDEIKRILQLKEEDPIYLFHVGRPL